ncbi:MAG: hypothetical protein IKU61_05070 [Clostridia bacterium]|nr:hypothetical protein [Clostridia bacterium]
MQKKIFSTILILCVLLCAMAFTLSVGAVADENGHEWTVTNNVYQVKNANDLIALAHNSKLWDKDFAVTGDIDVSTATYSGAATALAGNSFKPIGTSSSPFSGTFIATLDGSGNRRVIKLDVNTTAADTGLFGCAGSKTAGKTVEIKNIVVKGTVTSTKAAVGGIVGKGIGNLTVTDCTNRADVSGESNVGGLIGSYYAEINSAKLTISISSGRYANECQKSSLYPGGSVNVTTDRTDNDGKLGGAIGYLSVSNVNGVTVNITNADNSGYIGNNDYANPDGAGTLDRKNVGGVIGYVYVVGKVDTATINITNCDNTFPIATTNNQLGGICGTVLIQTDTGDKCDGGYIALPTTTKTNVTFTNCINASSADITANSFVGGIIGYIREGYAVSGNAVKVTGCTNKADVVAYNTEFGNNQAYDAGGIVGRISLDGLEGLFETTATSNKVIIDNCKNIGTVTTKNQAAGGIVGRVMGYYINGAQIEITNCTNGESGKTTGTVHTDREYAGGIVGFLYLPRGIYGMRDASGASNTYFKVSGCKNYAQVTKDNPEMVVDGKTTTDLDGEIAGIVGYINATGTENMDILFDDCHNYADFGTASAPLLDKNFGGIIGRALFSGTTFNSFVVDKDGNTAPRSFDASGNKLVITNCTNDGDCYSSYNGTSNVAGILAAGILQNGSTNCSNNAIIVSDCTNTGIMSGVKNAGGIVGRIIAQSKASDCSIEISNCINGANGTDKGAIIVSKDSAGGIASQLDVQTEVNTISYTVKNCKNYASVTSNASGTSLPSAHIGGIIGSFGLGSNHNTKYYLTGCENYGAVAANTAKRAGGIIGDVNFGANTMNGVQITISDCNNHGAVSAGQEGAGIVARVDYLNATADTSESFLKVEKCANYADVTVSGSRAGGIVGTYFLQKAGNVFTTDFSQCFNSGAIKAKSQVGGIAAQIITYEADAVAIENCLNIGSVESTGTTTDVNSAGTAGIVGSGYYSNGGKSFVIKNCYNKGVITAKEASCGNIIAKLPKTGTVTLTGAFYAPQTLKSGAITLGTKATEEVAFDTLSDVKLGGTFVWTYGRNNGLELKYLHECDTNNLWYTLSGTTLTTRCESANCESTTGFGKTYTASDKVYVQNGAAPVADKLYGSAANPFRSLEEANDYIDLLKSDNITVVVVGVVEVPADYEIKASVLTGEGTGTLYFKNMSTNDNRSLNFTHYHAFAAKINPASTTTVENLTIRAATNSGLFFYAHSLPFTMGEGLKMTCDTDEFNIVDVAVDQKDGLGARVYVFGGHNIQKHLGENAAILGFGNDTTSEILNEKAPQTTPLSSNITVRSGDYRHVSGWSYDIQYMTPNGTEIEFMYPTTGTTNMVIGKTNANDTLRITNISPFGCDYESVGEGRVANITIDGDAEVYQFNLGSHLDVKEAGEKRYPAIINLCLKGDMHGMEDYAPDSLDENPWGFYAGGHSDVAVMGNIWADKNSKYYDSAILDAHAFLGHGTYCTDDDAYAADSDYNHANRSIIYIEPCTHNKPVTKVSDYNLEATCISLPMNRIVCADCGGFVRAEMVDNGALDPFNHVVYAGLGFSNMYPEPNGVRIGSLEKVNSCCDASGIGTTPVICADGVFYVKDGGATKYAEGFGTTANPIGDFMTAYRLAAAYAEYTDADNPDGREAEIRVIDSITWNLKNQSEGYNDSPSRTFDYHIHMPGKVTVTSADHSDKATFMFGLNPSAQRSYIRLTGALEMNNLNIDFTNEFVKKADGTLNLAQPTRIHVLARDNAITMGEGLTMAADTDGVGTAAYTKGGADPSAQYHICLHGGYDGAPEDIAINTNVTALSGDYYYIGGTNYGSQGKVINGTATVTVGASGEDMLRTGYLSSYGVGAENTGDFTSNINIVGKVDVFTLEPTAQNGYVAENNLGAQTQKPRISNIYLKDGADLTLDCVHENGAFVRGEYEVNVYVGDNVTANTLTSIHKICGHDGGFTSEITGKVNHQHINAFADICTADGCTLNSYKYDHYDAAKTSFDGYSYLRSVNAKTPVDNGYTSSIYVNVYKLDQDLSDVVDWYSKFDSGYYVDGENSYGVARFIFDGVTREEAKDLVVDSGILYLFTDAFDKNNPPETKYIGEKGTERTFYADITDITIPESRVGDTLYAIAYMNLNGKMYYSEILPGTVNFNRQVAFKR